MTLTTKIDVDSFDVLFEGVKDNLPNFELKMDNEFGFTSGKLASMIDPIQLKGSFQTGLNSIYSNDDKNYIFNDVDQMCLTLSANMAKIKNVITEEIKPEAERLYNDIQNEKNNILEAEGIKDFVESKPEFAKYFKKLTWTNSSIFNLDARDVVTHVHSFLNINSASVSNTNLKIANKLSDQFSNVTDVAITNEQYDDLVNDLNKSEDCNCDEIGTECDCTSMFINHLFKRNQANRIFNDFYYTWNGTDLSQRSIDLNSKLSKFVKLTNSVKNYPLDLSNKAKATLLQNIEFFEKIYLCGMYHLILCKEHYFKNRLMIDATHINKVELNSFEKEGYDFETIYMHLKVNHEVPELPIPMNGISTLAIIDSSDTNKERYFKWKANQKKNARVIQMNATKKAYGRVLEKYLKSFDVSLIPSGTTMYDFISSNMNFVNSSREEVAKDDSNVMDHVYDLICRAKYNGTVIPKAIKMFRKELVDLVETYGQIKEDHPKLALAAVMAELIADFADKEFIK